MSARPPEPLVLTCACGECGIDPRGWGCESKHDAEAKAEAFRALSNRAERRGNLPEAVTLAGLADACADFKPLPEPPRRR